MSVRDLRGVMERENYSFGLFLSAYEPTGPMKAEAAAAGVHENDFGRFPRLQILTPADFFHGIGAKLPPLAPINRRHARVETRASHKAGGRAGVPSLSGAPPIYLSDIWEPSPIDNYKIHFARWNQHAQPLDVFVRDFGEWQAWQEYRAGRDDFNRPRIFSLMQDYRSVDEWVFGGIWNVLDRLPDRYVVELSDELRPLIGRLRIQSSYKDRATRCRMESYFETFRVASIERESYSGKAFPGLADLTVSLAEFREIAARNRADWHGPLINLKGVYLLRDRSDGKMYVGSAYGNEGIWSRWSAYAQSGHGGNAGTVDRFGDDPIVYGIANVEMSLLEPMLPGASNEEVFAREAHWKLALGSRDNGNLNRN